MSRPVEVPTEMATDDPRRRAFEAELDKALDRASDTLKPLFDTAYSALSDEEVESLHEIMFRLGGARQILIHRECTQEQVDENYREAKARRPSAGPFTLNEGVRRSFDTRLDKALDKAAGALRPLFDTAYAVLSALEIETLHEIMHKLGGARQILIDRDYTQEQVDEHYRDARARRLDLATWAKSPR